MLGKGRIAIDLVNVYDGPDKGATCIATYAWGDAVEVTTDGASGLTVTHEVVRSSGDAVTIERVDGFIRKPSSQSGLTLDDIVVPEGDAGARVLKVDFVDVQQGDGTVIELPDGRVMLVDGGDNQLFARYLAARFRAYSVDVAEPVECVLVTHGDADHFVGLVEIHESETNADPRKRLFLAPKRVYHNGLVKRASTTNGKTTPETKLLGPTRKNARGRHVVTPLADDPRDVDRTEMNRPFQQWARTLDAWEKRQPANAPMEVRRLDRNVRDAFDWLDDGPVTIEVLGPTTTTVDGERGLPFLGEPAPRVPVDGDSPRAHGGSPSASHTINGHSVVLKVTMGACSFLLTGDLNEESSDAMIALHDEGRIDLEATVFKTPHHGSADYSAEFLKRVSAAVSVISSGDEQERKEYIHPRATIMGALGRYARPSLAEPVIFVTELAAFFRMEGTAKLTDAKASARRKKARGSERFFAFSRSAFGIIKTRTDGRRLLVYTYSGKDDLKEAYAFTLSGDRVRGDVVKKV